MLRLSHFFIERFCGSILPSNVTSTGNEMFIKFHSNSYRTRPGFLISYQYFVRKCRIKPCKMGEGECQLHSECEGSLVCGHLNCALHRCCSSICYNDLDCFNQECNPDDYLCRLDSYSTDWSRCSQGSTCADGEGDCDRHTDCEGTLVCGNENCASGPIGMDCCVHTCLSDSDCPNQECNATIKQCRLDSYSTDWSNCSNISPCAEGEGDCDLNADCEGGLVCGKDNCESGPTGMDCCEIGKVNLHVKEIDKPVNFIF